MLQVDAGGSHTCVRLVNGKMRCWGQGFSGQLGDGNTEDIGDDEHPSVAGDVSVGAAVIAQATGVNHTCVVTANGRIRCWGSNSSGELGYGKTMSVDTPLEGGPVELF